MHRVAERQFTGDICEYKFLEENNMKKIFVNFIKKYPVTFICIILMAIVGVIGIEITGFFDVYADNFINNFIMAIITMLTSVISCSFLFTNVFECYKEKLPQKLIDYNLLKNLLAAFMGVVIYFITSFLSSVYIGTPYNGQYVPYPVTFIFINLACYFILTIKNIELSEYLQKVFINLLIVLILYVIVLIGTGVLYYISMILFGFNLSMRIFDVIIVETFLIIDLGTFISLENVDGEANAISKILIKYVMLIMVLIGFILFYIYLIKMLFSKAMPSNQVFKVCMVLFIMGLPTALMSRSFDEGTFYDKIIKYLPLAFSPALLLQILSLVLRLSQYGLTVARYFGITVLIYESAYLILYQFHYKKLKYILIVGAILAFIMMYVPIINVMQLPKFLLPQP